MYSFVRSDLWRRGRELFAKFRLFKIDSETVKYISKEEALYEERVDNKTTLVAIIKLE